MRWALSDKMIGRILAITLAVCVIVIAILVIVAPHKTGAA